MYIYMLMRDEKEGRKKQARSNKQQGKATQHNQCNHFSNELPHIFMRMYTCTCTFIIYTIYTMSYIYMYMYIYNFF